MHFMLPVIVPNTIKLLEDHLPVWLKVATALITILGFFVGAVTVAAAMLEVQPDIRELQEYRADSEPLLHFLVCRAFERDQGRETGACTFLLRESGLFDNLRAQGVIPMEYE